MGRVSYGQKRELERALERDRELLSRGSWTLKKTAKHYSAALGVEFGTATVRDALVELGLWVVKPKAKPELEPEPVGLQVPADVLVTVERRLGVMDKRLAEIEKRLWDIAAAGERPEPVNRNGHDTGGLFAEGVGNGKAKSGKSECKAGAAFAEFPG